MAIAAVIGSAAVLLSSMFSRDPEVEQPDGILGPGSCVGFEANGDAREVVCNGAGDDIVVEVLVPLDGECPTGTVGHRDRQGLGIACVAA
jgi:molecular chaperone DnaJ